MRYLCDPEVKAVKQKAPFHHDCECEFNSFHVSALKCDVPVQMQQTLESELCASASKRYVAVAGV